jgi:hypothetical protein
LRFTGQDGQVLLLSLLGALFFARGKWRSRNGRHGVAAAGFSAMLALGIAQVIGSLWDLPRPYEPHPSKAHLFPAASPDPSFPPTMRQTHTRSRLPSCRATARPASSR